MRVSILFEKVDRAPNRNLKRACLVLTVFEDSVKFSEMTWAHVYRSAPTKRRVMSHKNSRTNENL